mmetsp:Transcript_9388/g.16995  ORF Transcript_9388/g.16995 Transcript_9388/m.16995 type:complete len:469 (-) Transcript_9388:226-1632(-)
MASFKEQKAKILQHSENENLKGILPLSAREVLLEESVLKPAIAAAPIVTKKCFLDGKADYDASDLLKVMQRMPKGAVLHTHGIASTGMKDVVSAVQEEGHFYVWQGGEGNLEGTLKAFADGVTPEAGWEPASKLSADKLYAYLTVPCGIESVEACWATFGNMWMRLLPGTGVAPFYYGENKMFWRILKQFYDTGVLYVEIKESIYTPMVEYDGTELSDMAMVQLFQDTVELFCQKYPDFLGAKLVITCVKFQAPEDVAKGIIRAIDMKEKFPNSIAGFDLAGAEDLPLPLEAFQPGIEEGMRVAKERNIDLPLLIHGGETNMPDGEQIIDCILVGCRRIGHGFALARHPALIEEVKRKGMSLECNPISNQVLGYFPDLAAHSALGLFRAGIIMTISPDDPGMWHCDDVSYDFAGVAKAWRLSLAEIKALCRNSITEAMLDDSMKNSALQKWEGQWQTWVEAELSKAGL